MYKIMIWGGTYPDEFAPQKIIDSLRATPIRGVTTGIINEAAASTGKRQLTMNMNNAYPGKLSSPVYELRRAAEVIVQSQGFDAVIDLHANNGFGQDTACIGSGGVSPSVLGWLKQLGLKRLLLTDYNSLREHTTNSFGLELLSSSPRSKPSYLRSALTQLVNVGSTYTSKPSAFEWYRFCGDVSITQAQPRDMSKPPSGFELLPPALASKLGFINQPVCWFSYLSEPNEAGYWAELCTPINQPDATSWVF